MCAPSQVNMDESSMRRFNSQSSGGTTLVGDNVLVSPTSSAPWTDQKRAHSSLVFTGPDNRQWIDMDIISPKLLSELRRQNALPAVENPNTLAKGAARIKAWVRQNKRGVEIRLRRKIDEKHDEVTDIHLVSNPTDRADVKSPELAYTPALFELPAPLDSIVELPDTSSAAELDSEYHDPPSRSSTGDSIPETLPRYQPRSVLDSHPPTIPGRRGAPQPVQLDLDRRPSSSSSIVHTPTRGLSVRDPSAEDDWPLAPTEEPKTCGLVDEKKDPAGHIVSPPALPANVSGVSNLAPAEDDDKPVTPIERVQALEADLEDAKKRLADERKAKEDFEHILEVMREEARKTHDPQPTSPLSDRSGHILRNFRVAESRRYETETDVEPTSPAPSVSKSDRAVTKLKKKKSRPSKRTRKESAPKITEHPDSIVRDFSCSTAVGSPSSGNGKALPRRLTIDAGPERIWTEMLDEQATLLGSEHPLIAKAGYELRISRRQQHRQGADDALSAFRESQAIAVSNIGQGHPVVAAFSAHLQLLEQLSGVGPQEQLAEAVDEIAIRPKSQQPLPETMASPARHTPSPSIDMATAYTSIIERETESFLRDGQAPVDGSSTRATPAELPTIVTTLPPAPSGKDVTPPPEVMNPWANSWRRPHRPRNDMVVLSGLAFAAMTKIALNGILWVQRNYGPEYAVQQGKVRVRWTCSCGEQLFDDFTERRPGAARELEAYLNRPRAHANGGTTPISPASSQESRIFSQGSSNAPSTQTSWSSYGQPYNTNSPQDTKGPRLNASTAGLPYWSMPPEPPWLLTCANESRYTPKLAHLDMNPHRITSDKDLAMSLREHYFNINRKWYRTLRIRGLTTIEFVQFEVHQNKFVDIRKNPDMPLPGTRDYDFQPGELMPPVGSTYLLHLFKHPEDYDGELITYLRAPKKSGRLHIGVGWGIHLVEGFLADRVWMVVSGVFALGSVIFGSVWAWKRNDVQGAFGVAAWICTLAVLAVGWMQASLG